MRTIKIPTPDELNSMRSVIKMRDHECLTYTLIAERLGVTYNQAKQHYVRAKKHINDGAENIVFTREGLVISHLNPIDSNSLYQYPIIRVRYAENEEDPCEVGFWKTDFFDDIPEGKKKSYYKAWYHTTDRDGTADIE